MILLLSDFTYNDNENLLAEIRSRFTNRKYSLAYIPSSTDYSLKYFNNVKHHLSKYGNFDMQMFDIDMIARQTEMKEIFKKDVIYFSGGNPFYFLFKIKKHGLIQHVRDYYLNGGNLIGLSAGGILMAETIEISYFGCENAIKLKDLSGFAFIDFEIMPHWKSNEKFLKELLDYTVRTKRKVVTINDGEGILIDNEQCKLFGKFLMIDNGSIRPLRE